jgi:hypothetical protein
MTDLNAPMPCGHAARYSYPPDGDTHYCLVCEMEASRKALKLDEWITDGFGQFYPKYCEGCGAENQIVRPGDCRCGAGCYITKG